MAVSRGYAAVLASALAWVGCMLVVGAVCFGVLVSLQPFSAYVVISWIAFFLSVASLIAAGLYIAFCGPPRSSGCTLATALSMAATCAMFVALLVLWAMVVDMTAYDPRDLQLVRLGLLDDVSFRVFVYSERYEKFRLEWRRDNATKFDDSVVADARNGGAGLTAEGLAPETKYEYRVFGISGDSEELIQYNNAPYEMPAYVSPATFTVETLAASTYKLQDTNGTQSAEFAFVLGSCVIGNKYYDHPADWADAYAKDPLFMLFTGDFIYSDYPTFGGPLFENYAQRYRQAMQGLSFRAASATTPMLAMFDDHEFINDFAPDAEPDVFEGAIKAWFHFLGQTNPAFNQSRTGLSNDGDDALADYKTRAYYFDFHVGDVSFFVLDTRTTRPAVAAKDASLLGKAQKADLFRWLLDVNATSSLKFLVSSTMWTTKFDDKKSADSWEGYADERAEILAFIRDNAIRNCVFLSGDRHLLFVDELADGMFEISSSPLAGYSSASVSAADCDKFEYCDKDSVKGYSFPLSYITVLRVNTTVKDNDPEHVALTVEAYRNDEQKTPVLTKRFKWSHFAY